MATTNTPILNLTEAIPGSNEPFSTAVVNANWDAVDAFAGTTNTNIAALTTELDGIGDTWQTFTPALTAVTTNPNTGTGATFTGAYIRIGNTVSFTARIVLGATGVTQGSGTYALSLPLPAAGIAGALMIGHSYYAPAGANFAAGTVVWGMLNTAGTTLLTMSGSVAASAGSILAANMNIVYMGTYQCAP